MLGPDGPDADHDPDLFLATSPTTLMPSATTGALGRADLPVLTAQQRLDSPDDVQAYEDFFQQLRDAALTSHDLETLVLRIATEHRQNTAST